MPSIQEDVHACTMCGYCVPVCPAYQEAGWEGASPRGRIFALRQYQMRGPLDLLLRRHVKPGEEFARNSWECTGCGACEEVCPVDIPFDRLWDDVKAWMVSSGYERPELHPYLENVQAAEETGAKVLVTACAECYRAFARDYKAWGGNPPFSVFHISHYVEKLIREKRIAFTKPLPQKVAFHDACHMSRVSKVFEPPRQALKFIRDLKVLEILPHHQDALCSGAGGGFPAVFPEQAAAVAQRRLDAAEDTGAPSLVTTCPHAELHFEDVASKRNMTLSIVDLAEMLANAL